MGTLRTIIYFSSFECSPDELTKSLGVMPTRVWQKGELRIGTMIQQDNGWELSSKVEWNAENEDPPVVEHQIDDLLTSLELRRGVINDTWMEKSLTVVVYTKRSFPVFVLSSDMLKRIAFMGLSLSVDWYPVD